MPVETIENDSIPELSLATISAMNDREIDAAIHRYFVGLPYEHQWQATPGEESETCDLCDELSPWGPYVASKHCTKPPYYTEDMNLVLEIVNRVRQGCPATNDQPRSIDLYDAETEGKDFTSINTWLITVRAYIEYDEHKSWQNLAEVWHRDLAKGVCIALLLSLCHPLNDYTKALRYSDVEA